VSRVCGFYADNWQTYCGHFDAISPRMAYLAAYEAEPGDPACKTAADMADAMTALLGKG
jgi:hypothetical protein